MKIIAETPEEERLLARIAITSKNLATQNNRATAWPIWTILENGRKLSTGYGAGFFLTEAEARSHLKENDYHYKSPMLYVDSAHRNYELHDVIHLLLLAGNNDINSNHYGRLQ